MKNSLIILLTLFQSANAWAMCDAVDKVYLSDNDDNGVLLDLSYECSPTVKTGEICFYIKNDLVMVKGQVGGQGLPSNNLYRMSVKDAKSALKISLQTTVRDSMINYEYVKLSFDKKKNTGELEWGSRGMTPFSGYLVEKEYALIKCNTVSVKK
jgi:hypothetical protein